MKKLTLAYYVAIAELGAIVIALIATAVAAEASAQTADVAQAQEIVVEAPRSLPSPSDRAERSSYSSAPVVTTVVRITALYGDLDLTRPEHAERLMMRIDRVARDACATLDRLYPLNPDPECVSRAVANTTPAAKALITAALPK